MFIRTTAKEHKEAVHDVWNKLEQANLIFKDKYEGYYSTQDERFLTANEIYEDKEYVIYIQFNFYIINE